MLTARASPSPSNSNVFDYRVGRDVPSEWRGSRNLDGSLKGLGFGFDGSSAAYNNHLSNGVEHQRPRALIDAYGKDSSSRVSQFQGEANRDVGSRYNPQQACRVNVMPPLHDLSQSSQNLRKANGGGGNFQMPVVPTGVSTGMDKMSTCIADSRFVMPVLSVVNAHNSYPHPLHSNFALQNQSNQGPFIPNGALHLRPPGPPPPYSQGMLSGQNPCPVVSSNQPAGSAYSGLLGSLLAQGLISLTNQTPPHDSVGVEFKANLLKVRHESAIRALHGDLPRQCRTCGLRFKCQEEHRKHMDWHVAKNRTCKHRKQKPSRMWFVNTSMWLIASAATDAVPKFMTAKTNVEKKISDEEMVVPADEDQSSCSLCGERFEDFYSHETEDWMYKCAVYLNAPEGSTEGLDRSELGPIVHPKCRPEGSQRKRLRKC